MNSRWRREDFSCASKVMIRTATNNCGGRDFFWQGIDGEVLVSPRLYAHPISQLDSFRILLEGELRFSFIATIDGCVEGENSPWFFQQLMKMRKRQKEPIAFITPEMFEPHVFSIEIARRVDSERIDAYPPANQYVELLFEEPFSGLSQSQEFAGVHNINDTLRSLRGI